MPESPDIEEANPLLLESEDEYRSSLEYPPDTVDFDRNGDPENPLEWPGFYKWGVVALLSFLGFTVTFTCISLAPIAGHIVDDLNGSKGVKSATVMLVTIWELGEAVGPLFIAPLSEIFGRYRLYLTMNTMFIVTILLAALSPSTELLIVSRALTGISVACNVLSPAIIGDMFVPEQRGTALTVIMFTPLIGGTLGPITSGAILQALGWRAIIWISVVMASICQILFLTFFQETYKVQILRRRTARLSLEIGGLEKNKRPVVDLASLGHSIMRPAVVLLNSSVLAAILLFGSYMFSHFYIVSTTLPEILEDNYGLSPTETGLVFIANAIGTIISFIISKVLLDKIYLKLRTRSKGDGLPEYRLPLSIIGALTLPPAVILYGWCAEYRLPLCVLVFSMIWLRASVMLASSPLTAYIVDACGIYSASAMAGLISMRCLAGAFLPLSVSHLTERLGYGGGFSMLGGLGLVFALIPTMVFHYGAQWRQRSRYTASN
ncbi:unnamed protein product [Penicillium nalgiovense]|uniref:Major facilitator superfamily (MFS) profile domain-containing protein n=1 Tax=Penicillium nalgiovense TaxID=60175 RepID=A0A9W4HLE1_PENNA|nr:unnamed protein product [Penicillium nalgiovense]CAG8016662.1 unnamed protein product [Penicillium nalgiovense]CAG8030776.1 unnamed protein product [Penicillium nalgiovense]CAG8031477.1 unnamed protein product [Penicillium nalgiovense]CAG8050243.1 unnamed protein product [Penicillium nalgiovense]